MQLVINGRQRPFSAPLTLAQLLEQLQLQPDQVVLELNGDIVMQAEFDERALQDDDRLEIVQFVGGG